MQYKVKEVKYMGDIVSDKGVKPDPDKVQAIDKMDTLEDKAALHRFLGMVKYLAWYIPGESDITSPLRDLLKEGVAWNWQSEHDAAFHKVKQLLVSAPVKVFYDIQKPITIQADASQLGLGACLLQE